MHADTWCTPSMVLSAREERNTPSTPCCTQCSQPQPTDNTHANDVVGMRMLPGRSRTLAEVGRSTSWCLGHVYVLCRSRCPRLAMRSVTPCTARCTTMIRKSSALGTRVCSQIRASVLCIRVYCCIRMPWTAACGCPLLACQPTAETSPCCCQAGRTQESRMAQHGQACPTKQLTCP